MIRRPRLFRDRAEVRDRLRGVNLYPPSRVADVRLLRSSSSRWAPRPQQRGTSVSEASGRYRCYLAIPGVDGPRVCLVEDVEEPRPEFEASSIR